MAGSNKSYFWTSYSDLMSSLFFVMLVLFVLTIVLLIRRVNATEAQLEKIQEIEKSIEKIDNKYFEYNEEYKRHTLKNVQVSFEKNSSDIYDIPEIDRQKLLKAGWSIIYFMKQAQEEIPDANYLLIVEGQTSNDSYRRNYELSYERALSLVKFWSQNNITFDDLPCEVIISGSGKSSEFREYPDIPSNSRNQRFVIHIIPKPGILDN